MITIPNCVLVPWSVRFYAPETNMPIIWHLDFANTDEAERGPLLRSLFEASAVSGGVNATVTYSPFFPTLIGNLCTLKVRLSDYLHIELKMRIMSDEVNDGASYDPCFPWACKGHDK